MNASRNVVAAATGVAVLATFCLGEAGAERGNAPDAAKYSLRVPGGLAFAEFKGYEDWAVISIHRTGDLLKVILGNRVVMDAFRAGVPRNGKPFPDGSKMAKVEWRPKQSPDAPYDVDVPGVIYDLDFMVKDAKRFADSGGWGYAVFKHDPVSGMYAPATGSHKPPQANDARCGFKCHTIVTDKDFVFTDYAER
jgi:Cytochrome P460